MFAINLDSKSQKIKKCLGLSITRATLTLGALVLLMPAIAAASSSTSSLPFTDPDSSVGDEFGQAISLSQDGTIALVTAPRTDYGGYTASGTAYVYVNSGGTWSEAAQLAPSSSGDDYDFGASGEISSDGSEIIIGANDAVNDSGVGAGAAYVFNEPVGGWNNGGAVIQPNIDLEGSDSQAGDDFGISVGFSSDDSTAIVGANYHGPDYGEGAAYIFSEPTGGWNGTYENESTILTPPSGGSYNFLGSSVALSANGSVALVGAPGQGPDTTLPGYAVQFSEPAGGWSSTPTLSSGTVITSSDGAAYDLFGQSVSLTSDGNTAVVGAPGHADSGLLAAGATYTFASNGTSWSQTSELSAPDPTQFADYGISTAISPDGTSMLVGSPAHQDASTGNYNVGEAYEYSSLGDGSWSAPKPLSPSTTTAQQDFGWDVAIVDNNGAGGNTFVGAPGLTSVPSQSTNGVAEAKLGNAAPDEGGTGSVAGAAYLFDLSPPVINSVGPNVSGAGEEVTISGSHLLPTFNPNDGSVSVGFNKGKLPAQIVSDSETQITVVVPTGAKTDPIKITTPNGTVSSSIYTVGPSITGFAPSSQGEGNNVTIKGADLTGSTVTLNGQSLPIVSNTAKAVVVTLPTNAVSGYITVNTSDGGSAVSPAPLSILPPQVTSAPKATIGSTLTIKGKELAGVTSVQFSGSAGAQPVLSASNTAVTVTVPVGAISGTVTLTAPSGTATGNVTIKN